MGRPSHSDAYRRIYDVVCSIPHGRVATYGQVAKLAGLPGRARQVGYALHALASDLEVPWQRVVNAQGRVSSRAEPMMEDVQRALLSDEGIVFRNGRLDLSRFGWSPGGG